MMRPLTRPYGLYAGMVFQAEVLGFLIQMDSKGRNRPIEVEIERYNTQKPKELPADEFVTFKVQTDWNKVFTCTLPDPGWWCMTASDPMTASNPMRREMRFHEGKQYLVRQRTTIWVHVDARASTSK